MKILTYYANENPGNPFIVWNYSGINDKWVYNLPKKQRDIFLFK